MGVPPPVAKTMLVYEAAAALGVGVELPDSEGGGSRPSASGKPGGAPVNDAELDLIRQRVAHSKGLGPKPEAQVTPSSQVAAMQATLSGT